MKKIILFIAAMTLAVSVFAQTSGEFFAFDGGANPFAIIAPSDGSYVQTVADGKLTIDVNKGASNWGFMQLWIKAFPSGYKYDLTNSPRFKVTAYVCETCNDVKVTVRYKQVIAEGNEKQVETSQMVTKNSQELVFDFTSQIVSSGINMAELQELHIDISNSYEVGYVGTVVFEDMTIGDLPNKNQELKNNAVSIYPTAVSNALTVENAASVKIIDVIGNVVFASEKLALVQTINVSALKAGVYFVVAGNDVFKIVKK